MNWTINLSLGDIINSFVGAFFGFGLTLLIEYIVEKRAEKISLSKSIETIRYELSEIQESIADATSEIQLTFDVPVWEAVVQSGNIFLFSQKSYYMPLLKIYSSIKSINMIEKEDEGNDTELMQTRKQLGQAIKVLLDNPEFK